MQKLVYTIYKEFCEDFLRRICSIPEFAGKQQFCGKDK
jgi:hypothetical protein